MSVSESTFLFEINLEGLTTYLSRKHFHIQIKFADVFTINLKDPNKFNSLLSRRTKKGDGKPESKRGRKKSKPRTGKSIQFKKNIDTLIDYMKKYPMELSLWTIYHPKYRVGSTPIPWSWNYIDYLQRVQKSKDIMPPPPTTLEGNFDVFDEYTSKRMGFVKLKLKLSYLTETETTSPQSVDKSTSHISLYSELTCIPQKPPSVIDLTIEPGIIKTVYGGSKGKAKRRNKPKTVSHKEEKQESDTKANNDTELHDTVNCVRNLHSSLVSLVKSDTVISENKQIAIIKSKSCSSINKDHLNILNYVFNSSTGRFGNRVYCVGYFTVENNLANPKVPSSNSSDGKRSPEKSETPELQERYKFRMCNSAMTCSDSVCSVSIQQEAEHLITISKCKEVKCEHKKFRELPPPPDDRILLDLHNLKEDCCQITEKIEEVVGGVKAGMQMGEDQCYCECECKFGFVKRTTYCKICGGYEIAGEELARKLAYEMPHPCPIYHNLIDKKPKPPAPVAKSKSKCSEFEKKGKKGKAKQDDRFKFNYGYTAPQIGHGQCTAPCTGTLGNVPKKMGWLWNAENVPGLKFRPSWRPGAANKHVVRMLRNAKNPGAVSKKRRRDAGKGKRPLKRPLLIIHKKDGEYTVTMETMKTFTKPRMPNQHPYEDKPVITYTIGRTDEENMERRRKKERAQRRLERAQRAFIQSAFKNMCKDICIKTYHQALGITPDVEIPDCPCYPTLPIQDNCDLSHSCSCSEDPSLTDSDYTDCDEWIVEFTPPNALFDQSFKNKKVQCTDHATQYTYLDYRVKLLDRYGNQVPRFFKGPDGKQQCSDLGGFYGPDKKWLDINIDGYIAPDGRWAPLQFIGPNNEQVDGEAGKFQTADGSWLVVGVDGYVDAQGVWKFYKSPTGSSKKKCVDKKPKPTGPSVVQKDSKKQKGQKQKGGKQAVTKASEATWSCFGDATPKHLCKMGIVGHGHDKKLLHSVLKDMKARGENVTIPTASSVPRLSRKKGKGKHSNVDFKDSESYFTDRYECHHHAPSSKGVVADHGRGHKKYFRISSYKNQRPRQRVASLKSQGRSVSSFHVPCFHSFMGSEAMKKQNYDRLMARYQASLEKKGVGTQS